MNIRSATDQDIPTLAVFAKDLWTLHADKEPQLINKEYVSASDGEQYFKEFIHNPSSIILVAEDKEILGYCKVDIKEVEPFFSNQKTLYIDELFIKADARNKNVATAFLNEIEDIAHENEIHMIKGRIYTFNEPSKNLFSKNNFTELYSEYFKVLD